MKKLKQLYEWFLKTFTKHKIGYCGCVSVPTKNGIACGECGKILNEKRF